MNSRAQAGRRGWILVIPRDGEAVVGDVHHEIEPHDSQADHAQFMLLVWNLVRHGCALRKISVATVKLRLQSAELGCPLKLR